MSQQLSECLLTGKPLSFPAIDMHAHLGRYSHAMSSYDPGDFVAQIDRLGVQQAVCSHMQCMSHDVSWGNNEVWQAMKNYPGRIAGYISLFPSSKEAVAEEMKICLDRGFTGIKFHSANGFHYDDPAYEPAWKLASEHQMPMLFHGHGSKPNSTDIMFLADRYPDAPILLAHSGGSGDLTAVVRLANSYPNIFLELCASRSPLGVIKLLVNQAGLNKIIWGSDCHFLSMSQQLGRLLGSDLDDKEKEAILYKNAKNILDKVKTDKKSVT